jgi:amino acid adenylation domain-containing protein
VHNILEQSAVSYPEKVALVCGEQRYSYREINEKADALALLLVQKDLKPQDRVIIYLDNSVESIIGLFATLKAGGIFVIVNSSIKSRKLRFILNDTGARYLIAAITKKDTVYALDFDQLLLEQIIWVAPNGKEVDDAIRHQAIKRPLQIWLNTCFKGSIKSRTESINCDDDDLAALIYTSGSSGKPKGVMSAHYNVLAATQSINQYLQNRHDDIILNLLPLSFDYGLYQIFLAFIVGATVVLFESIWYPYQIIEILNKEKITGFPIVPTIAAILAKMKNLNAFDNRHVRYLTNTGDTLTFPLIEKLREIFPHAEIFSMYGLTECKRATYLPPAQITKRAGSVGIPIPNSQAFIVNSQGQEVGPNEVGELVVRGNHVMQGYWKSEHETKHLFRHGQHRSEALLFTNDLFKKDELGYLYFIGRKDDLLKIKGERVSPKEIECYLNSIKGIIQSAVVGIADDICGKSIAAYIVCHKDANIDVSNIRKLCKQDLEPHLIPQKIIMVDALPLTANRKVDKKRLIEMH